MIQTALAVDDPAAPAPEACSSTATRQPAPRTDVLEDSK